VYDAFMVGADEAAVAAADEVLSTTPSSGETTVELLVATADDGESDTEMLCVCVVAVALPDCIESDEVVVVATVLAVAAAAVRTGAPEMPGPTALAFASPVAPVETRAVCAIESAVALAAVTVLENGDSTPVNRSASPMPPLSDYAIVK
jgi:hypothetical protein